MTYCQLHPNGVSQGICMACAAEASQQRQQGALGQQGMAAWVPPHPPNEHSFYVDVTRDALFCRCGIHISGECLKATGFSRGYAHNQRLADEAQRWRDEASKLALELRIAEREISRLKGKR